MKKMFFVVICAMMLSMALSSCGNGTTVAATDVDSTAVDTVLVDTFAVDSVVADTVAIDSVVAE